MSSLSDHWKLLTLSTLMFLTLCILGSWQVSRLYQKEQLIQQLEQALEADPTKLEFRPGLFTRVKVTGHFADIPPLLLKSKPLEGKVGQYVVSPFLTEDNQWILVLRGWTDENLTNPSSEPITLYGQIRTVSPPQWFAPDNKPGSWIRIDPISMGQHLGISFAPFYILEESPPTPLLPLPLKPSIPNNHLSYIITWFGLAFALCVMVFLFIRKDQARGR